MYIGDLIASLSGVVGREESIPASLKGGSKSVDCGELGIVEIVCDDCIDQRCVCVGLICKEGVDAILVPVENGVLFPLENDDLGVRNPEGGVK